MTAMGALGLLAFQFTMPPWWGFLLAVVIVILGGIVATSFAGPNLAAWDPPVATAKPSGCVGDCCCGGLLMP
jgi:hypothetical protein